MSEEFFQPKTLDTQSPLHVCDPSIVSAHPLTGVGRALSYRLPSTMVGKVQPGCLVRVPLRNRTELAIVLEIGAVSEVPLSRLKYVSALEQPLPVLTPDLLALAQWMSVYYGSPFEVIMEAMLPSAVRKGMRPQQFRFLKLANRLSAEELAALERRAPKQAALYRFLAQQLANRPVKKAEILKKLNISASSADALVERGVVEETSSPVERTAYDDEMDEADHASSVDHQLTEEQQAAVDSLAGSLETGKFCVHLLHGVTGSGKTEVYLQVLKSALEKGGGAILMVPEVALAPQTVGRLRARLEQVGVKAVVWHSHLSDGERYDAWSALASGAARVVVGARSAIFAPVQNLRLVLVDEEHEPAYKQEETPRYHGRDVAVYRASVAEALCVLGSATPSLETLYNAQQGKYRLDRLTKRIDDRQLPVVHIVDMKREVTSQKGPGIFSRMLIDKMRDRLEKGEQTILFLNRRGYNTSMMCPDCGYVAECDHCSVTLTHHKAEQALRCHLCGFEDRAPSICPKCRSPKIKWKGSGTQRIEDIAKQFLPKARIVRIDADTMQKKNLFRVILNDFRKGRIDILVGTQMIAKGLDFPNVTLVGLIEADLSLHLPDFRAAERTFQLLVQVAGRAGRGDRAGEVVAQSFLPYSPPVQFGRAQDFDGFSEEELANRREYQYPPFRRLIHHIFRGKNPDKLAFFAEQWARRAEERFGSLAEVRGPAPAPIEKIKDNYRYQVWYFTPSIYRLMPQIQALRQEFPMDKDIVDVLDADPVNLI